MRMSNFHVVPKVPDSLAHLDLDVVVEVLSRHAINVPEIGRRLRRPSPSAVGQPQTCRRRDRDRGAAFGSCRAEQRSNRMILAGAMRLRCSPFATAIALTGAAGSHKHQRRRVEYQRQRQQPVAHSNLPLARRGRPGSDRCAKRAACARRASSSNTGPAQSLRTRTEILATAR
jgi:hypothetical protein